MKNIGNIEKYLKDSFGWNIQVETFEEYRKKLPYIMLASADYAILSLDGFQGVMIEPKNKDFRNTKNIVQNIEKRIGLPGILIVDNIDSYQRKSLIRERINFIVPDKQIYLPLIGLYLNERGLGVHNNNKSDKLSSVATLLILMQLSQKSIQGKSVTDIAKRTGYSVKTVSLAVNDLEKEGLVNIHTEGRKKILNFNLAPNEIWKKVKVMSDGIIEKKLYTSKDNLASEIGFKSSDAALSNVSMLVVPAQETYAVYGRDKRIKELELNPEIGSTIVEVWKTDPALTANNGIVDVFSLALNYKDDDDPRINKEINKLIEESL